MAGVRRPERALLGLALSASLALPGSVAGGDEPYRPTPENLRARASFQEARFGLFVHWGVYSVLGEGEWVMQQKRMTVREYERDLPPYFNPVRFDPAAWVSMVKAAGMRYITITSKHHDGFAMFDSKLGDWDVVDRTPYGKDVLKLLADECHRQGIKLFFYHSQLDWHHPDYFPRGRTGLFAGRPETGDWNRYLDYMDGQLRELLTGYGEVGGIWFDGWWDKPDAEWRLQKTYELIHSLQPAALVGSNHHRKPFPGEDFQMFEKDLPGANTAGFNDKSEVGTLPLEMCETMNNSWGYNKTDERYKSTRDLVHLLVKAAGYDANLLLNVGPRPDGAIQPEFVSRLQEMGRWLARNGEAIYGTRGGPIPPRPWGVTTQKGNRVFVHVLDWPDAVLVLPKTATTVKTVRKASYLADAVAVPFSVQPDGVTLRLRPERDPLDTVIVLELAGP
jgi:alpha-L-fucosidase